MLLLKCAVVDSKNSRFLKELETSGLLITLRIKIPILSKIPVVGDTLAWRYKINETVNKFLLAGDKFISVMHLRQPRFTYSACGPFNKNKERIQKCKEAGGSRYIYQNELDKACYQRDMANICLNICVEGQLLLKCYVIKHLILLKWLASMVWIHFLTKSLLKALLEVKLSQTTIWFSLRI